MRWKTLAVIVATSLPSLAMAFSGAEDTYSRYHKAAEVAKLCRGLDYSSSQIDAIAGVIASQLSEDIGAKRLSLLTAAQRDAHDLVDSQGCDSSEAQELLQLFDRDLAPVL